MISRLRSKRKFSGGKYKKSSKKKKKELGRKPIFFRIGDKKVKKMPARGGNIKLKMVSNKSANVLDSKTKKYFTLPIKFVEKNSANPHFVRRNIITKGTIIVTEKGKAKVTSRPTQHGTVNAVLLD